MDLISRKEVRRLICRNNDKYGYSDRFHEFTDEVLNNLPSAFEGMTYGEVLTAIFPNFTFQKAWDEASAKHCMIMWTGENLMCDIPLYFWDSPYKGVSK